MSVLFCHLSVVFLVIYCLNPRMCESTPREVVSPALSRLYWHFTLLLWGGEIDGPPNANSWIRPCVIYNVFGKKNCSLQFICLVTSCV